MSASTIVLLCLASALLVVTLGLFTHSIARNLQTGRDPEDTPEE